MRLFRALLVAMWIALVGYTALVISGHGWGLFTVFFGDITAMTWPGQFNFDFMGFLLLSALWVAWRDGFGAHGLLLSPIAFVGGIGFLAPYLFFLSYRHATIAELLLGKQARQ